MNPLTRQAVAAEVRAALGRYGITQKELAHRTGMSSGYLSERLAAKRAFSTDDIADIAEALGVDPLALLGAAA